jgi:hypothetical protein
MIEDFKNVWKDATGDPLDYAAADSAALAKVRKKKQNYLHASMNEIIVGVPPTGIVWLRLLQLKTMRPQDKYHELGNQWFESHGVNRMAKTRALRVLEKRGLIRVIHKSRTGSPRVYIIPKAKRRVRL